MPDRPELKPAKAAQFIEDIQVAIAAAAAKAHDGLTLVEFGEIFYDFLRLTVEGLESVPVPGPLKKRWALEAISSLFDSVADKMIPVYVFPIWIMVKPSVRALILHFSEGAIESVLRLLRE
jgi:hypothetical protein